MRARLGFCVAIVRVVNVVEGFCFSLFRFMAPQNAKKCSTQFMRALIVDFPRAFSTCLPKSFHSQN